MVIKSVCTFLLLRMHGKGNGNLGFPSSFFHKRFFFWGLWGDGLFFSTNFGCLNRALNIWCWSDAKLDAKIQQ